MSNHIYENDVLFEHRDIFSYMKKHNIFQNLVFLDWFKVILLSFMKHDVY